ncbi:MAG: CaiB/BaiF CoA transferase family protein, partial [Hyphomonadaceae bacterium]
MKALDLPPPHLRPAGSETALGGLRVVDFSHFVAGPYCTVMLADFGADVLKIEHPDRGDDMRHARYAPGDDVGSPFIWGNRNKRSVGLDLSTQAGRDVARALVDSADILVENFSTGVMGRLGLGYEEVSQSNPRLIYCSISAAGRSGPLAHRAGFDSIAQAESGFMSVNGHPGDPPVVCGAPVKDMTTAMMACNAILAAIVARERLGKGQFVEISLFDQGVAMLG